MPSTKYRFRDIDVDVEDINIHYPNLLVIDLEAMLNWRSILGTTLYLPACPKSVLELYPELSRLCLMTEENRMMSGIGGSLIRDR